VFHRDVMALNGLPRQKQETRMTADLYWLTLTALTTAVIAVPYVTERILRVGFLSALGYSKDSSTGGFEQPSEKPAAWAKRAYAAHRNAVENFVVFAVLVLTAHILGIGGGIVAVAAQTYFFARLVHYVVYVAGMPVVRTLSFFVALGAIFTIGYAILTTVV
jgi:uncharacterized MAPEG superfamily protein